MFLAEAREDLDRVVADSREPEALALKLFQLSLQLDEPAFLKYGHQSAERRKTSIAPLGPMMD